MLYVHDQKTIKWLEYAKGKDTNRPKTSEYAVVEYGDNKWLFVSDNFVAHAINQYDTKVVGLADAEVGSYVLNPISGEFIRKETATKTLVDDVTNILKRTLGENTVCLHNQPCDERFIIPTSSIKNPVYGTWAISVESAENPEALFLGWGVNKKIVNVIDKKYKYFVTVNAKYIKTIDMLDMRKIWTKLPLNGRWLKEAIVFKDIPERRVMIVMPLYINY